MTHTPRLSLMLHRLIGRWLDFRCDLTGLVISDGDVLLDLATGRD